MSQTSFKESHQKTKKPIIHFLVGLPASGKSTFAQLIAQAENCEIISTDDIRAELYGNATIQGSWHSIETEAINGIVNELTNSKNVIYDATNFKRSFRIDFLQKVTKKVKSKKVKVKNNKIELERAGDRDLTANFDFYCIAWYLNTPLETCIAWNQKRVRQVPEAVIKNMYAVLKDFPPLTGEGFAKVRTIDVTSNKMSPEFVIKQINQQVEGLERSIINSQNRNANITPHQYSKLADFDRLIHLISLIIKYPGIGNLHRTNPQLLENILGHQPKFNNNIQEIAAIVAKKHGTVYGCEQAIAVEAARAIAHDLEYLTEVGIISGGDKSNIELLNIKISNIKSDTPISREEEKPQPLSLQTRVFFHSYSDKEVFQRLISTIKLIVNQPFLQDFGKGSLKTLAQALEQAGGIYNAESGLPMLRKDIENILKPYKIIPSFPMRHGYFAGTGIFSQQELIKLFDILQSQAKSLDDPLVLDFYNTFKERMLQTKLIDSKENIYPIRSIANHSIVDERHLHETSLLKKLPSLENAIVKGELLELNTFSGSPKYESDANSFITVYPLQIVFHNLAWYLGYECIGKDAQSGLLKLQRLDRLFLGNFQNQHRSRQEQTKALEKLQKLLQASAGIYLGNSVEDQYRFLSRNKNKRMEVCVTVELWFDDKIFHFITEGTKRFAQIKMSRPRSVGKVSLPKSIFCLEAPTGDKQFPNRFQTVLPKWCLNDFDLLRWILGFGGSVKVIQPSELVEKVKKVATGILGAVEE
ncbi:WYL domain-containing protein [Mastigocoleus sp. MO_188.B34]|uniref:WYL domain-containing protein n=1 Tax=Mastigocoleus sp. MO_188.B34 TaxID=3036635 RepID=UPI0026162A98|nr:WYL domain-containing protein [Mastigocoleus sp. MO_188.B34]MDJ0698110.1 WYL domain-containing protein [Mastigocoleus sp. MO_188.B34]